MLVPTGAPVTPVVRLPGMAMVPGPLQLVPITDIGSVRVPVRVKGSPAHTGLGLAMVEAMEPSQQVIVRLENVIVSLLAHVWVCTIKPAVLAFWVQIGPYVSVPDWARLPGTPTNCVLTVAPSI